MRDGDDIYVIPLGQTVRCNDGAGRRWDPAHGPGDGYFTYSNLNFPIVASIIERVTGERFDLWMRREVLEPMKLDACYNWPTCSDDAVARAVVLTQDGKAVRDDLDGRRPDCPVFAEDGDPCDLSTLAAWREWRALLAAGRAAHFGDGPRPGRTHAAQSAGRWTACESFAAFGRDDAHASMALRRRQRRHRQGLLLQLRAGDADSSQRRSRGCKDDPARDGVRWAGHAGDAYGLRSGLWIDRARGIGVAYFVTGLPDDPPRGAKRLSRRRRSRVSADNSVLKR